MDSSVREDLVFSVIEGQRVDHTYLLYLVCQIVLNSRFCTSVVSFPSFLPDVHTVANDPLQLPWHSHITASICKGCILPP